MAQIAEISEQVQLKCCGKKFYDFFENKMDHLPRLFPQYFESYKLVEGNSLTHGGVSIWKNNFGFGEDSSCCCSYFCLFKYFDFQFNQFFFFPQL